jgi:hypothetical protein
MTPTSSAASAPVALTVTEYRKQVLAQLRQYLGQAKVADLERCTRRLASVLPYQDNLRANVVLAMYGGGKDSSFLVAALRFMQLYLNEGRGSTFRVRIVTNRHSGMPAAVMHNIGRVYAALKMTDDPDVELLLVDGNVISRFFQDLPIPLALSLRDRTSILISGHRCQADPRPTFCNSCNLAMENALALALGHGDRAHVTVTGDSPAELRRYLVWIHRAARDLNIEPPPGANGFSGLMHRLGGIAHNLNRDLFGDMEHEIADRELDLRAVTDEPIFFSIYEDTTYRSTDHWDLLTVYLGFQFDDIAFAFTESDCGNPALMAHLNGLRHERFLRQSYTTGIHEYVDYAIGLMQKKEFPERLIEAIAARYRTPADVHNMRRKMDEYADETFHLTEDQLVCMIYSPFTAAAEHLHLYLSAEKPELLPDEQRIRDLLQGAVSESDLPELEHRLAELSGLELPYLRVLYRSPIIPTRQTNAPGDNPISIVLKNDPHKAVIQRKSETGGTVSEFITGR